MSTPGIHPDRPATVAIERARGVRMNGLEGPDNE